MIDWLTRCERASVIGLLFVTGVLVLGGCRGADEAPRWTAVPEGVRVVTHGPANDAARAANRVTVERDLVIRGASPDAPFLRAFDVAVDGFGRIYVYDAGRPTIEAFAVDGESIRSFGSGQGQGPEDLSDVGRIAIVGEDLVFLRPGQLTLWSTDTGEFRSSTQFALARPIQAASGLPDRTLVAAFRRSVPAGGQETVVTRYSASDGTQRQQYISLPEGGDIFIERREGGMDRINTLVSRGEVCIAVSPTGDVYVTRGDEYEVLALSADGTTRWVLRVDLPRLAFTESDRELATANARRIKEDLRGYDADWPDAHPALSTRAKSDPVKYGFGYSIRVDGHGHIYVFPFAPQSGAVTTDRPVDVYSDDGERLFSGTMADISWLAAHGDFVYGIENDANGDQQVVRYTLSKPF